MFKKILALFVSGVLFGCAWEESPLKPAGDLNAPILVDLVQSSEGILNLTFDEVLGAVTIKRDDGILVTVESREKNAQAVLDPPPRPGVELGLTVEATDAAGNWGLWERRVWGVNPNPAVVLINEINPAGSGRHPDSIELLVTSPGSLGGLTIVDGIPMDSGLTYVLGDVDVRAGDLILVHLKPMGQPGEVDECGEIDVSQGYDASPGCRDFWVRGYGGLTATTGVVALLGSPRGKVLDGILYSNRSADASDKYQGFGSAASLEKAKWITETGFWGPLEGLCNPSIALNSSFLTSTRTFNRIPGDLRALHKGAWQVCPTSGATPGGANTTAAYVF